MQCFWKLRTSNSAFLVFLAKKRNKKTFKNCWINYNERFPKKKNCWKKKRLIFLQCFLLIFYLLHVDVCDSMTNRIGKPVSNSSWGCLCSIENAWLYFFPLSQHISLEKNVLSFISIDGCWMKRVGEWVLRQTTPL